MEYLLDKIVSRRHMAADYTRTIFNLLSNIEEYRREGLKSLVAMWNEKDSMQKILKNRFYLCSKINKINHMLLHSTLDTSHYCCDHVVPRYEMNHNIECDKCKADCEVECFNNESVFKGVLRNK